MCAKTLNQKAEQGSERGPGDVAAFAEGPRAMPTRLPEDPRPAG